MTTLPEIRIVLRDAGPRRGLERSVRHQQCATGVVGCTAAKARGHAHPKGWPGPAEQIGNMVCIPHKRKQSDSRCVNCWKTVAICSGGSDRCKRVRPWRMGFIDHFSLRTPPSVYLEEAFKLREASACRALGNDCRHESIYAALPFSCPYGDESTAISKAASPACRAATHAHG